MNLFKLFGCWWRDRHNDVPLWTPQQGRLWCCLSCGRKKPRSTTWP